ncbi:hypothetical protein CRG98_048181 [Punica granatum]|uniref:Alpha/beta hydrolase fold-3 domain-containing protein n=2 Tax=Punica granatum TaxID=22663 RepID=A0A2I0HJB1_PUNGR|nr:hypothetical protein CRG98_048181 [Punica granatum]
MFPLGVIDLIWELALSASANRDHEYCNPTVNGGSKVLDKIRTLGWRYLVTGCRGDPLVDRQVEAARLLEKKGLTVESHFDDGGFHGVEFSDIFRKKALFFLVKNFVSTVSN